VFSIFENTTSIDARGWARNVLNASGYAHSHVIRGLVPDPTPKLSYFAVDRTPEVFLYPNPASNYLRLKWDDESNLDLNYKIVNVVGQTVQQGNLVRGNTDAYIAIDELAKGHYQLILTNSNQDVNQTSFTKL
jgi:hypothetical protein